MSFEPHSSLLLTACAVLFFINAALAAHTPPAPLSEGAGSLEEVATKQTQKEGYPAPVLSVNWTDSAAESEKDTSEAETCVQVKPIGAININRFEFLASFFGMRVPVTCNGITFQDFYPCEEEFIRQNGCCNPKCVMFLSELPDQCWEDIAINVCQMESKQSSLILDVLAKRCSVIPKTLWCTEPCDSRHVLPSVPLELPSFEFINQLSTLSKPSQCETFTLNRFSECLSDFYKEEGCCKEKCVSVFSEISAACWDGIQSRLCSEADDQVRAIMGLLTRRCDAKRRVFECEVPSPREEIEDESLSLNVSVCERKGSCEATDQSLLEAVMDGNLTSVQILIAHGANPNVQSYFGETPLQYASKGGRLDIVVELLAAGAVVDSRDFSNETALAKAVSDGSTEIIATLLEAGATVDATDLYGVTPLWYASYYGYVTIVKLLIDHNADLNIKGRWAYESPESSRTPLSVAIKRKQFKVAKLLKKAGAQRA